jgi:spore germination protein KC
MSLLKGFKIVICAVLIASLMTGCMNTVHLKDMAIIEGIGVDTEEDSVSVIVQTLKLGAESGSETPQGNRTYNTDEDGSTVVNAISNLSKDLAKKLFFGQNKIIVFSRNTAENNFEREVDYFFRSSESRPDVVVCMAESTAKEIIESKENDSGVPCENMVYLLENGQESGVSAYVTVADLLNMYSDKTTDIYLPVVKMKENSDSVQTAGIGLFSDNKLVHITDEEETLGFMLLTGKVENCTVKYQDSQLGLVSVELSSTKVKKNVQIENGNIVFCVNLQMKMIIDEIENGIVTSLDEKAIDDIVSNINSEVERLCRKGFEACTSNNSDCLRVGEYLAKASPNSYDKLSDQWDTYFKTVTLSVNADARLKKLSDNTQLD